MDLVCSYRHAGAPAGGHLLSTTPQRIPSMKRTFATVGLQAIAAAPRLHAGCGATGYSWPVDADIQVVNPTAMHAFDTAKATRRLKEPSP
jgi:hypothetical protein